MKPYLVKEVVDILTRTTKVTQPQAVGAPMASQAHIDVIHQAMVGVTIEGTAAASFRGAPYSSGGKTGTTQVVQIKQGEKYDASRLPEHHHDHALYVAYAPVVNARIALALIVENAGFGAQNAAPIARRILDYWLLQRYPSLEDIAAVQQAQATAPIGRPRHAQDVPLTE
jgi:penicillin-binding protein 2